MLFFLVSIGLPVALSTNIKLKSSPFSVPKSSFFLAITLAVPGVFNVFTNVISGALLPYVGTHVNLPSPFISVTDTVTS